MGVDPVSIALIAGTAMSAVSEVAQGFSEKKAADNNARAYEIQAQNIETQKGITSTQYRNKANQLQGQATTRAASRGLKITGSTAQSISQSLTQLGLDKSYEIYNLNTQKHTALQNASSERRRGRSALMSGIMSGAQTAFEGFLTPDAALGNLFGTAKTSKNLLSGGFNTSAQSMMNNYKIS